MTVLCWHLCLQEQPELLCSNEASLLCTTICISIISQRQPPQDTTDNLVKANTFLPQYILGCTNSITKTTPNHENYTEVGKDCSKINICSRQSYSTLHSQWCLAHCKIRQREEHAEHTSSTVGVSRSLRGQGLVTCRWLIQVHNFRAAS